MSDKVIITGGLGMVASAVCRALVASGRRPVIYDAGSDTALVADVAARCDIVQGTLADLPRFMGVVQEHKPAAVLHFAALIGPRVGQFPWDSLHTNLLGATAVFECARLTGIERVIFPSSKEAYGAVAERHRHPTYDPVPEEHPREPHNLYGKLKRALEDVAAHYAQLYGLDLIAFRFASSYGPGKPGRSQSIPIMGMIEAAVANRPFHLERGIEQKDHLCYSGEAANATLAALAAPRQPGSLRAYNISSDELLSLGEMIAILQELYPGWKGSAGPGLDYRNIGTGGYIAMDIGKARRELGFTPKFDFRSAVRDYAELFRRLSL